MPLQTNCELIDKTGRMFHPVDLLVIKNFGGHMSLFQCEHCGSVENTACSGQGIKMMADYFDFAGIEDRKGKLLCSVCAPTKYADGGKTKFGVWHNRFPRKILPMGMFKTNSVGNLEHIETGETDYSKYAIDVSL